MKIIAVDGKLYAPYKGDMLYGANGLDVQHVFFIRDYQSDRRYMTAYKMPYSGRINVTCKGPTPDVRTQAQIVTAHYDVTKGDTYAYFTPSRNELNFTSWTKWGNWSIKLQAYQANHTAPISQQPETTGTGEGGDGYIKIEYEKITGGV